MQRRDAKNPKGSRGRNFCKTLDTRRVAQYCLKPKPHIILLAWHNRIREFGWGGRRVGSVRKNTDWRGDMGWRDFLVASQVRVALFVVCLGVFVPGQVSATPVMYAGASSAFVSIDGGPGEGGRFLNGTLNGSLEFHMFNLSPDLNDSSISYFDFTLQGWYQGEISDSGTPATTSLHYFLDGSGRYSDSDSTYAILSLGRATVPSGLQVGAEQYSFFISSFGSPGVNGLRSNGSFSTDSFVLSAWSDGKLRTGLEGFGQFGTPEIYLQGALSQTNVPEPGSAFLLGSAIAVFLRRKALQVEA